MARKFVSFVGLGNQPNNQSNTEKTIGYDPVSYLFPDGRKSSETPFVQRAILEHSGPNFFDEILFFYTQASQERHQHYLETEIIQLGIRPEIIRSYLIPSDEEQDTSAQWQWFTLLSQNIGDGDQIVFDFTHGFRSVPIIFSAAINFLQTMRNFTLLHAYYGFKGRPGTIFDMSDFFVINAWANATRKLIDEADASALTELATKSQSAPFSEAFNNELIASIKDISARVKNIDANNIENSASNLLSHLDSARTLQIGSTGNSPLATELLDLIRTKYEPLLPTSNVSEGYTKEYFTTQLALIKLLAQHGLYMQAFTVMRECTASLGVLGVKNPKNRDCIKKRTTKEARNKRRHYAEVFFRMLQFKKEEWEFKDELDSVPEKTYADELLDFYTNLEKANILPALQMITKDITHIRNGFDHAWTAFPSMHEDIPEKARQCINELEHIISAIFNTPALLKEVQE